MKKSELRLSMIVSTFKDRLIELDEQEFIDWVEKVAFPKKTDKMEPKKMEPNYTIMKSMLAERESEPISRRELHAVLLFGTGGWDDLSEETILEQFISIFGENQIPKKETK